MASSFRYDINIHLLLSGVRKRRIQWLLRCYIRLVTFLRLLYFPPSTVIEDFEPSGSSTCANDFLKVQKLNIFQSHYSRNFQLRLMTRKRFQKKFIISLVCICHFIFLGIQNFSSNSKYSRSFEFGSEIMMILS